MELIQRSSVNVDLSNKSPVTANLFKRVSPKYTKSTLIKELKNNFSQHENILKDLMLYELEEDDFCKILESSASKKVKMFLETHSDSPKEIKLELIKMGYEHSSRLCKEMIEKNALSTADLDKISLCTLESHCGDILLNYFRNYIYKRSVDSLENNDSIAEYYSAIAILEELSSKYSDEKAAIDLLKYKSNFKTKLECEENYDEFNVRDDHCEAECDYCEDCGCCMGMQGC